jgi:hypothetical protein
MPGTYPAVEVSFAWGVASSSVPASPDWIDESAYVASLDIKHGREDQFSEPGAGTLELTLDNSTGRFDPDNASGPLYGDLQPLTWVRVRAGDSSVDSDVFYGQVSIEGFRLAASQFTGRMVVNVTVLDLFEQLANTQLPESVWAYEVEADTPTVWYRLGESSGTVATDSSGNQRHGAYEGGATFNSRAGLVAESGDAAISFDAAGMIAVSPSLTLTPAFTVEFLAEPGTLTAGSWTLFMQTSGTSSPSWEIRINSATLTVTTSTGAGTGQHFWDSSATFAEGVTHLVQVVFNGASTKIYVDDADTTGADYGFGSHPSSFTGPVTVGAVTTPTGSVTLDEVGVYSSALSSARRAAHYAAATAPWEGSLAGDRIALLLGTVGFTLFAGGDPGVTTMPSAELDGNDALSEIQAANKAERGDLYVDHQNGGLVTFRNRRARWMDARSLTSQATFGDGSGEVTYTAVDIQDDRIVNFATVQRAGGAAVTARDAVSEAQYQRRSFSETGLLLESDAEAQSRADLLVAEKKDRHRRVRSVTLEPAKSTHPAWAQVFARQIGDRVTVKWRPPYGGTYSFPSIVEGIAHSWRPGDARPWRTTFYLSPVPYGATGEPYWVLGTSVLGSTTRAGY